MAKDIQKLIKKLVKKHNKNLDDNKIQVVSAKALKKKADSGLGA